MSFISYFQHLVVVRKRERAEEQKDAISSSSAVEKTRGPFSPCKSNWMQSLCHLLGTITFPLALQGWAWWARFNEENDVAGDARKAQGSTYSLMVLGVQLGEKSSPESSVGVNHWSCLGCTLPLGQWAPALPQLQKEPPCHVTVLTCPESTGTQVPPALLISS